MLCNSLKLANPYKTDIYASPLFNIPFHNGSEMRTAPLPRWTFNTELVVLARFRMFHVSELYCECG